MPACLGIELRNQFEELEFWMLPFYELSLARFFGSKASIFDASDTHSTKVAGLFSQ
jgi:hypothetical protein